MGGEVGRGTNVSAPSTHKILRKPDIALSIDIDADANFVEPGAGQINAVPTRRRLINHTFLNSVCAVIWCWVWTCISDTFATHSIVSEAFIGDALAERAPIGAGVAEAAMD